MMIITVFTLVFVVAGASVDVQVSPPFKPSKRPTKLLHTVTENGRSEAELLLLDSIAGNLARDTPSMYRVSGASWRNNTDDSYSIWLQELERNANVVVDDTLSEAPLADILGYFLSSEMSFIRCNYNDTSASVAITLAACIGNSTLISGDDATANILQNANVPLYRDVRGNDIDATIDSNVLEQCSKSVFVFQTPDKSQFLADWSIAQRASYMPWNTSSSAQKNALKSVAKEGAAAYGWGPENDYVTTLNARGVWVHASDYNKNLPALANGALQEGQRQRRDMIQRNNNGSTADPSKHTVSFLMSDGDNLQWTLGPWSTSESWYGCKDRGSVPIGWTLSPAIADLAPAAASRILSSKTDNDEFIAGPSGYGYVYPTTLPASNRSIFAERTIEAMRSLDMNIVNVLGQNDNAPECSQIEDLLQDGLIFYPWGDGYAGLHGQIWTCSERPVLSGRWSLWGNDTNVANDMVGVEAMTRKLLSAATATDPRSPDSYTLIPVHAWTHTYSDVVEIVSALEEDGRFDVVLPSAMLSKISANVPPSA